jgi:hypothetical protein
VEIAPGVPASWAALDPDPPLFASAPWLEVMADRIEGDHLWFVREPGTDRGVGFFGTIIGDGSVSEAKNPWRLLFEPCAIRSLTDDAVAEQAVVRSAGPDLDRWFPSLVLLYPGMECFALGPGGASPAALDEAVAAIVAHARHSGLRSVAFLYTQPEDTVLPSALRRAGFADFPLTLRANLSPPGDCFADYLAAMGSKRRQNIANLRRKLARQGVSVTRLPLSRASDDDLEKLVVLRLRHREKYGRRPDAEGERDQLRTFRSRFGDRAMVYAAMADQGSAMADQALLSFVLFLDAGGVRHAWMNGTDYDDPRSRYAYFELGFHAPIEDAYLGRAREISFGYGAEHAKLLRGCRLEPVSGFVLPLSAEDSAAARRAAAVLRSGLVVPNLAAG